MIYEEHYSRADDWLPVYSILLDHWDSYGHEAQSYMLAGLFPGVHQLRDLWAELHPLVQVYDWLDVNQAVSDMQEMGGYNGDPFRAFDVRRQQIENEICGVIREYRVRTFAFVTGGAA